MNRKEGRENKDFKKGGILGQGVGALIRGDWSPFTNYDFEHISYRFLLLLLLTFNRYMFVGKKALKYSKNQSQKTSQKNFKYHTKKTFQNNRKTIDKTAKQLDFFLPQKVKSLKNCSCQTT